MKSSLTQFLRRRSNGSILEELAHDLREAMDDFEVRAIISLVSCSLDSSFCDVSSVDEQAHDVAALAPSVVPAHHQSVRAVPGRSRGLSRATSPQRSQTQ